MTETEGWQIPDCADHCARCETALVVGDEVTVVLQLGGDGPNREDLCATCGEQVGEVGATGEQSGDSANEQPPARDESVFFWRRPLPEPDARSPVVDYAVLREMFHRMLTRKEDVYRRLSYLVGLVLIRKRHLRLRGFEVREGREVMVVSRGAGHPELVVPAPHLDAEALVDTREHLTRLLAADLPDDDLALLESDGGREAEDPEAGEDEERPAGSSAAAGEDDPDGPAAALN